MASAWELDTRPVRPCTVCGAIPDRTIDWPRLADVHVTFGNSALCETCAALAGANAVRELTDRAESRRSEDPTDAVLSLVRLLVAAFGHVPPPAEVAPEEFRHRVIEPLSDDVAALWQRLEPLIREGPVGPPVRVRGVIEDLSEESDDEHRTTRVLLDGPKASLADADGQPWLLCDGHTVWRRDRSSGAMYAGPYTGRDLPAGRGPGLAARRSREEAELFSFGTPLGPIKATTYLDRPAWAFRFAAPPHKPYDMRVVVDDGTGLVLEEQFGTHSWSRWTSFESGVEVEDQLFVWNGPTVEPAQHRPNRDLELERHRREQREQQAWFAEHVAAQPLRIRGGTVEVMLHVHEDDGSFQASIEGSALGGALARRPRSGDWWELGWSEVTHCWSDETWDWAMTEFHPDARLTDYELADLKRALGS